MSENSWKTFWVALLATLRNIFMAYGVSEVSIKRLKRRCIDLQSEIRASRVMSVILVTIILIVAMAAVLIIAPRSDAPKRASIAAAQDLTVVGTVRDSVGTLVPGAAVTVTNQRTGLTYTNTADENAQYEVNIPDSAWAEGDTILVHAEMGSAQGDASGTAHDVNPYTLQVDVPLSTAIPEFGSLLGALVASFLVGIVAIVALGEKRRKS